MARRTRSMESIRDRLVAQQTECQHRLMVLRKELLGATASGHVEGTSANHPADTSSDVLLAETDVSIMMELERDLHEYDQALDRIAHGTFGQCIDCGDQIDPARLEAMPTAVRCLRCQSKWEFRSAR